MFRKLITYGFIVIYLFSFSEAREVFKLPILIEHYQAHKLQNPDMEITDFLAMHYLSSQDHDQDDQKLPFKSPDHCVSTLLTLALPNTYKFTINIEYIPEEKSQNFKYSNHFSSNHISGIYRPPRA